MKLDGVYVIDRLENIGDYAAINANFARAVEVIRQGGLEKLPVGRNEIDGENVWVNVADAELVPTAERRAELHHAYFDIQIPLGGEETFGVARFDPAASGSFDAEKDVGFYEQKLEYVTLKPGEFAIFWPRTCAHAPACTLAARCVQRKLIFKVTA